MRHVTLCRNRPSPLLRPHSVGPSTPPLKQPLEIALATPLSHEAFPGLQRCGAEHLASCPDLALENCLPAPPFLGLCQFTSAPSPRSVSLSPAVFSSLAAPSEPSPSSPCFSSHPAQACQPPVGGSLSPSALPLLPSVLILPFLPAVYQDGPPTPTVQSTSWLDLATSPSAWGSVSRETSVPRRPPAFTRYRHLAPATEGDPFSPQC